MRLLDKATDYNNKNSVGLMLHVAKKFIMFCSHTR